MKISFFYKMTVRNYWFVSVLCC